MQVPVQDPISEYSQRKLRTRSSVDPLKPSGFYLQLEMYRLVLGDLLSLCENYVDYFNSSTSN
jgi:hypothetical protein